MVNIAILSSGSGNSSRKLLENIKNIKSNVSVIITNKSDAKVITWIFQCAIDFKVHWCNFTSGTMCATIAGLWTVYKMGSKN